MLWKWYSYFASKTGYFPSLFLSGKFIYCIQATFIWKFFKVMLHIFVFTDQFLDTLQHWCYAAWCHSPLDVLPLSTRFRICCTMVQSDYVWVVREYIFSSSWIKNINKHNAHLCPLQILVKGSQETTIPAETIPYRLSTIRTAYLLLCTHIRERVKYFYRTSLISKKTALLNNVNRVHNITVSFLVAAKWH